MHFVIHRLESVDSTNDIAARKADEGAPEGTVVIASSQTGGKGRRGRNWFSPPGSGLYLSLILRPPVPLDQFWQMAFVASVAAADGIRRLSGLPARIKWPNDVLLNGRKVCGILVEACKPVGEQARAAVIGIGINANIHEFPQEIAETATSIAVELGMEIDLRLLEESVLAAIEAGYTRYLQEGFPGILQAWKELDCTTGRHVRVHAPEGVVEGTAVDVGSDGSLTVKRVDGTLAHLSAGDASFTT